VLEFSTVPSGKNLSMHMRSNLVAGDGNGDGVMNDECMWTEIKKEKKQKGRKCTGVKVGWKMKERKQTRGKHHRF
jgi:hypothetical protein